MNSLECEYCFDHVTNQISHFEQKHAKFDEIGNLVKLTDEELELRKNKLRNYKLKCLQKFNIKCTKCGQCEWRYYQSSDDGHVKPYCYPCQKDRGVTYATRKKNASGSHTKKQLEELLKKHSVCPGCKKSWNDIPFSKGGKKYRITFDHIIPLSKGGSNDIENIQPLCYRCNFSKGFSR